MKTTLKRSLGFVLSLVMIASLFAGMTFTVSAAEIDRVIVDFRSADALKASGGAPYIHSPSAVEPDPLTGGKFSYSTEKQALRIEYAESKVQPAFRLMSVMTAPNLIPMDYKYFVVVYQAKTDADYDLYLFNSINVGKKVTIKTDGKDTDGKWVISDAFDISATNADGKGILQRWNAGSYNNRIWFECEDKEAEFYIKEYGFFKSPEDAKAYYATADLSKTPTSTVKPSAPAAGSSTAGSASEGTFAVTTSPTYEEKNAPTGQEETTNVVPYIMDLSSVAAMNRTKVEWYKHDGNEEGKQQVIANAGEDNSNQLLYSPGSSWSPYRGMLRFQEPKLVLASDYKWGRITYKVVDDTAGQIKVTNNGGAGSMVVVQNTLASNGEWTVSAPFDMTKCQFINRFENRMHVTIEYTGTNPEAKVYIKNFMLFGSEKQAYEYVGDSKETADTVISYSSLTFGQGGTAGFLNGEKYGIHHIDEANSTLVITHSPNVNGKTGYMAKIKFDKKTEYDINNVYTRVLYAAKNPEGVDSVNLYLAHDANGETVMVAKDVKNTNGEFVLSDTFSLSPTMPARYLSGLHCSLYANTAKEGGEYTIKAIYFFPNRETAAKFDVAGGDTSVTINGNDISKYQIVVNRDSHTSLTAAGQLQKRLFELTGVTVPIAGDDTPVTEYEILIGKSARELSTKYFDELQATDYNRSRGVIKLEGNNLVITCAIPKADATLVDSFNLSALYENMSNVPESIDISAPHERDTNVDPYKVYDWGADVNDPTPEVFTNSFDFDEGYFAEENGLDNWEFYNGVYRTKKAEGEALSYIHLFERDAKFALDLKYTDAAADADMGIMLRYNSADAWVKAGYDFEKGEWYIDSCEGMDFYADRIASAKASVAPGVVYRLTLECDETLAKLYVNGELVLSSKSATHTSPGRVAFYKNNVNLTVDNAELTMYSGEGTIWTDVLHTKLPYNSYIEGGSVYEMNDGSLVYQNHNGVTYRSSDMGKTWDETEKVFPISGYMNVLKLNDGSFMQIFSEGGYWQSRISKDEGKTWEVGGKICATRYQNTAAGAGNMNDKLLQTASGKLFYGQNYEITTGNVDGRAVFCEFYYSDDLGKTWTKSETDSWEIEGNEKHSHFGEAKMLECSDGTIRMYDSWNAYGCLVYSESKDGGKTFGPLVKMEDFVSSRSSMQFVRDKWGETDYTYYMVWVNNIPIKGNAMPRSRLTMAKTTDGKNWTILGDVWRWESNYMASGHINHVVDPFINVTEDYILVGSGFSEHTALPGEPTVSSYHNAQRQHIYAIPKASIVPGEPIGTFTDVDTNDSYYEAVKFAVDEGLFNGTSDTTFSPDMIMNRAMFVTVLGRLAKADVAAHTAPTFTDVAAGQWYTSYVEWAAANGIVNGLGEGIFGIDGSITVEQACTILYRYADGKAAEAASGKNIADFKDSDCISAWAADGVKWAVENGIYNGVGESLSPTCPAPRWLVAEIFANYASLMA